MITFFPQIFQAQILLMIETVVTYWIMNLSPCSKVRCSHRRIYSIQHPSPTWMSKDGMARQITALIRQFGTIRSTRGATVCAIRQSDQIRSARNRIRMTYCSCSNYNSSSNSSNCWCNSNSASVGLRIQAQGRLTVNEASCMVMDREPAEMSRTVKSIHSWWTVMPEGHRRHSCNNSSSRHRSNNRPWISVDHGTAPRISGMIKTGALAVAVAGHVAASVQTSVEETGK